MVFIITQSVFSAQSIVADKSLLFPDTLKYELIFIDF
jgi:hypothetical protein